MKYDNLQFERPGVRRISQLLHAARGGHEQCLLPFEHVDFALAVAIIDDRESSGSRSDS